jgi:Uma2 family endonuclease
MEAREETMTVDEYLRASRDWEVKHEWVGGQAWAITGARPVHNLMATNVVAELRNRLRGSPCRPMSSDQRIEVEGGESYFYPDLIVVCGRFELSSRDDITITNPRVVVEVLSPSTRDYDLGTKFEHYRQIASVSDILYIDPDRRHVIHHARTEDGWLRRDLHEGAVRITGIDGLEVPLDEIYADLDAVRDEA